MGMTVFKTIEPAGITASIKNLHLLFKNQKGAQLPEPAGYLQLTFLVKHIKPNNDIKMHEMQK